MTFWGEEGGSFWVSLPSLFHEIFQAKGVFSPHPYNLLWPLNGLMHQIFKINKSLHLTPYSFKFVNSPHGCMLRILIGYMKHFWHGLMAGHKNYRTIMQLMLNSCGNWGHPKFSFVSRPFFIGTIITGKKHIHNFRMPKIIFCFWPFL